MLKNHAPHTFFLRKVNAKFTTVSHLQYSGNAREIIEATSIEQIQQAWQKAQAENLPVLFLGQGSNMLFLEDFQGVVIVNRLSGIQHTEDSDYHYLHVNGGEKLASVSGMVSLSRD